MMTTLARHMRTRLQAGSTIYSDSSCPKGQLHTQRCTVALTAEAPNRSVGRCKVIVVLKHGSRQMVGPVVVLCTGHILQVEPQATCS